MSDEVERWTATRRTALILQIVRGDTTTAEAARQGDLKVGDLQHWYGPFLTGGEHSLKSGASEETELKERAIKMLP